MKELFTGEEFFLCYTYSVMENNYYEELIQKISDAIKRQDYTTASALIAEEYRMPYIPLDVEKKLDEFSHMIPVNYSDSLVKSFDYEQIEDFLKGDEAMQITALSYLKDCNIRPYLPLLQEYLNSNTSRFLKGICIMLLQEQNVDKTFMMETEERRYEFMPATVTPPEDSDGFERACSYLRDTLERDNPSGAKIAFELLLNECYKKLPESFEEEEGVYLAQSVMRATLLALNSESEWREYVKDLGISEEYLWNIKF